MFKAAKLPRPLVAAALFLLFGAPTCGEEGRDKDDRPAREFSDMDPEGDWGTTCSNGDFDGIEGPLAMDILDVGLRETTDQNAVVDVQFAGLIEDFLASREGPGKPNISVQLNLSNSGFVEIRLEDDCTWKVTDGLFEVIATFETIAEGSFLALEFPGLQSADIDSVEVESFDYDVLGERDGTYCDSATASAPS